MDILIPRTNFTAVVKPRLYLVGFCALLAWGLLAVHPTAYGGDLPAFSNSLTKINLERHDRVLLAKFNNPPRYTMDQTVVAELSALLDWVERDEQTRVLVLTGASPNIFISHYDTGEIGRKSKQPQRAAAAGPRPLHGMHRALLKIERLPKPVIAAINGRAHGGGYETALACDFRFLASDGTVGLPETGIGIIPGGGGTQRLPRLIGVGKAKELIMLGRTVDAITALQLGMVNRVVAPEKLIEETLAFANQLARRSPVALAAVKQVMREASALPLEDALHVEQDAYYTTTRSVDWGRRGE